MTKLDELKKRLTPGKVYRRADLSKWSAAVDRDLRTLVDAGELTKVSAGVYLRPKQTAFGKAPADEKDLVEAFLKDKRFLLTTPNAYNALGVGTTQLYNQTVVYNRKRHGQFKLGNRFYDFRKKAEFPEALSKEFLLVDLVNNVKRLAEGESVILKQVKAKAKALEPSALKRAVDDYGGVRAKRFFSEILDEQTQLHA